MMSRTAGDSRPPVGDDPISRPEEDLLQRSPFAKQIANAIMRVDDQQGFVIALNGPWGSGKTSVINLVKQHLNAEIEAKRIVVSEFRPWWFSGHDQLIRQYFHHLWTVFKKTDIPSGMAKLGDAFESMGNFFDKLSGIPSMPGTSGWFSRLLFAFGIAFSSSARSRQMDLDGLRNKVVAQLEKQEARLLIIIDDIDRLTPEEMRQVFQVVRAVGNFPKTIYLLSFDATVVEEALVKVQAGPGRDYLEKIIQMPFDIPQPDASALNRFFLKHLEDVIGDPPAHLWSANEWPSLFHDCIEPYIRSIRDMKRLLNRLRMAYPLVRGEVHVGEFIAFQTLCVFEPVLCEYLANNRRQFVGNPEDEEKELSEALRQERSTKLMESLRISNAKAADATLAALFPRWSSWAGRTPFPHWPGDAGKWRGSGRMRHAQVVDRFFTLQVPPGDISAAEIQEILDSAGDQSVFAAHLRRLAKETGPDGVTRLHVFLDKFQDCTQSRVQAADIQRIVSAIFDVGDELQIESDHVGMFAYDNKTLMGRLVYQLLKRLPSQDSRFDCLMHATERGSAVSMVTHFIGVIGQEFGKFKNPHPLRPDNERTVSKMQLADLEAIALKRIRDAARSGQLESRPRLVVILYSWMEWAGVGEPRAYVTALVTSDQGFVSFIVGCAGKTRQESMDGYKEWWTVSKEVIADFAGLSADETAKRINTILEGSPAWLSDHDREVIRGVLEDLRKPRDSFGDVIGDDDP
jgi:predicted KAP-like P-loop ATPase